MQPPLMDRRDTQPLQHMQKWFRAGAVRSSAGPARGCSVTHSKAIGKGEGRTSNAPGRVGGCPLHSSSAESQVWSLILSQMGLKEVSPGGSTSNRRAEAHPRPLREATVVTLLGTAAPLEALPPNAAFLWLSRPPDPKPPRDRGSGARSAVCWPCGLSFVPCEMG